MDTRGPSSLRCLVLPTCHAAVDVWCVDLQDAKLSLCKSLSSPHSSHSSHSSAAKPNFFRKSLPTFSVLYVLCAPPCLSQFST